MNESQYTDIGSISGVAAVEPTLQASEGQNQTISRFGRSFTMLVPDYTIEGIPLTSDLVNNFSILPTNVTQGSNLQAGESGVVLLSENNSAYFGVGVGGTVNILGQNFQVVGIHGSSGPSDNLVLYMNLSDAQAITNNTGVVTGLTVFAQSPDVVSQVQSSISSLHPELTVSPVADELTQLQSEQSSYTTVLANAQATVNQSETTALEEIVVVIAATSLIVLFVMLYTVRERTKEIGTLKAIGFSNSTVMGQFILEGILLSVIAGAVGIAIGVVAAPYLANLLVPMNLFGSNTAASYASRLPGLSVGAAINPELILLGFGAALLLGALGSLYPAWRAAKIRPAEAMKYE